MVPSHFFFSGAEGPVKSSSTPFFHSLLALAWSQNFSTRDLVHHQTESPSESLAGLRPAVSSPHTHWDAFCLLISPWIWSVPFSAALASSPSFAHSASGGSFVCSAHDATGCVLERSGRRAQASCCAQIRSCQSAQAERCGREGVCAGEDRCREANKGRRLFTLEPSPAALVPFFVKHARLECVHAIWQEAPLH